MAEAVLEVFRGTSEGGAPQEYKVTITPGMVVLDALHQIQATQAPDLAVRWNCKAGKCGSCSAEVNGKPRLTCKTRMDSLPTGQPITIRPMKSFPVIKEFYDPLLRLVRKSAKPPQNDGASLWLFWLVRRLFQCIVWSNDYPTSVICVTSSL